MNERKKLILLMPTVATQNTFLIDTRFSFDSPPELMRLLYGHLFKGP